MSDTKIPDTNSPANLRILAAACHPHTLQDSTVVDICVQASDARCPATELSVTTDPCASEPWALNISGTVLLKAGGVSDNFKQQKMGHLHGTLVKRELLPRCEDGFLGSMTSVNHFTRVQAQQLFTADGRLWHKFRGRGIRGSDDDEAWVFEIGSLNVTSVWRRQGVGRKLVEAVREGIVKLAGEHQRAVLTVLLLGTTKQEVDDYKAVCPSARGAELQRVSTEVRLRAKKFWRSLGFRRLSQRSNWFGWAGNALSSGDYITAAIEWESEDDGERRIDAHDDDRSPDVPERLRRIDS